MRSTLFNLTFAIFFLGVLSASAQSTCFFEDFSQPTNGWIFSNGAQLRNYNNPANGCVSDKGIVTPGAESNNPVVIKTPLINSNGNEFIRVSFDIYRFDLLLSCASSSDFTCPTSLDATINVAGNPITGITNIFIPKIGPLGSPKISFAIPVGNQLPSGTQFSVSITLNSRNGLPRCTQLTSKYAFDNIEICQNTTQDETNAENDDFCSLSTTGNTFSGNLSSNDNGSNLVYTLANGPYANNRTNTSGALLTIFQNGNFRLNRLNASYSIFDFTYKITDTVTGKSDYATARVCFTEGGPLPLSLISFTAIRQKENANIQWSTGFESNLTRFEIQRKGINGFETVGYKIPKNSANGATYQFEEKNTNNAPTEYRLKISETGVSDKFSKIQVISGLNNGLSVHMFPNPSRGDVFIHITNPNQQQQLEIMDVSGSLLQKIKLNGKSQWTISHLKPGTYFVRLSGSVNQIISTHRLVVQ
jgi:hypothetical protein